MLVFIDDSGDAGFNLAKGSSKIFVISCIIFDDELEAEKTAVKIKELRRELCFPEDMEFKFNKSKRIVRERFLENVNRFKFRIRSIIVDKRVIQSLELRGNKNSFYSYAIKLVLKHSDCSIINAKVRIDGSGDRAFRRNFLLYLRRQLNGVQGKIMENCKLVDSKSNVLVQMADMVAGSVKRSFDLDKNDCAVYKEIIKKHIDDEWCFK